MSDTGEDGTFSWLIKGRVIMNNKPPTVLEKLAAYEAAKLSTQPLYDEWSQSYEQDLVGNLGYTGHLIASNALAEFAPTRQPPSLI